MPAQRKSTVAMLLSFARVAAAILTLSASTVSAACTNCTARVADHQHLGNITSTNSYVVRDLGYHGTIDSWEINSYGDTFHCQYQDPTTTRDCSPVSVNSASLDTDDPLYVEEFNLNDGAPQAFVPFDDTEQPNYNWGMGITNGKY